MLVYRGLYTGGYIGGVYIGGIYRGMPKHILYAYCLPILHMPMHIALSLSSFIINHSYLCFFFVSISISFDQIINAH